METIEFRVWSRPLKRWLTDSDGSLHCRSNWMMDIFTGEIVDWVNSRGGEEEYYSPERERIYAENSSGKISTFIKQMYTGIDDKNDQKIYDGDIVDFNGTKVLIEWNASEGCFWGGCNKQRHILQYWDMLRVIGNIIENPNLLES
ncbi:MAG: YopX family protein [Synergistaceae bacterium]